MSPSQKKKMSLDLKTLSSDFIVDFLAILRLTSMVYAVDWVLNNLTNNKLHIIAWNRCAPGYFTQKFHFNLATFMWSFAGVLLTYCAYVRVQ